MVSKIIHNVAERPISADLREIGARFEAYRLSRNITQAQLAESAGVSRSTLARLEANGAAGLDTVLRVLRALDVSDRMFLLVPEAIPSPLDPKSTKRQRARPKQRRISTDRPRWGDEK
jgi:transcriptional regulator with XRE-family HTH domain